MKTVYILIIPYYTNFNVRLHHIKILAINTYSAEYLAAGMTDSEDQSFRGIFWHRNSVGI